MKLGWCLLAAVLLAGCNDAPVRDTSVMLDQNTVPVNDSRTRAIQCGPDRMLEVTGQAPDTGDIQVLIEDGNSVVVFSARFPGDHAFPFETDDLPGTSGLWSLRVDRSLEFNRPFEVTLSC